MLNQELLNEISEFLESRAKKICSTCSRPGGCTLPDQARGILTAIRTHQQSHPNSTGCLQCGKWYDDLEVIYRRIADCPDK